MRIHIHLDDDLVDELDRRVGARRRSPFIANALRAALDDERRWELIESSIGTLADSNHAWDADAAAWVRDQRRSDSHRIG